MTCGVRVTHFILPMIILCFIGFSSVSFAQDTIVDQDLNVNTQAWFDFNTTHSVFEDKTLTTQYGFRTIRPRIYDRLLVIPTLNFKELGWHLMDWKKYITYSFHLGAGAIYSRNINSNDNLEIRLIQGVKFNIPTIRELTLNNYLRLEERFQTRFDSRGINSGFRLRYRLSTNLSWGKYLSKFTEGLYIPLIAEIFVNLKKSDRFNDVLRLSPGLGYRFKSGWKTELYFIFNRTKNITETERNSNDFIFRLRIYKAPAVKDEPELVPQIIE